MIPATVTVNVSGDQQTIEVNAVTSVALGDLLWDWAAQCASSPAGELMLLAGGGSLLDPSETLAHLGLGDGTVIRLVTEDEAMEVLTPNTIGPAKAANADPVVGPADGSGPAGPARSRAPSGPSNERRVIPPPAPTPVPRVMATPAAPAPPTGWSDAPPAPPAPPPTAEGASPAPSTDRTTVPPVPSMPLAPASPPPAAPSIAIAPGPALAFTGEDELPRRVGGGTRLSRAVLALFSRKPTSAPPPGTFLKASTPSAGERYRQALQATDRKHNLEVIIRRATLPRSAVIAVVSPKGGPGKTTMTALLGTLFAELRRDPVIALDANPDFGDLKDKLSYQDTDTALVDSLAGWLGENPGAAPANLSRQLGVGPHGLRYVATPRPPDGAVLSEAEYSGVMRRMIDAADYDLYAWLIHRLRDYAGILLVDCGTGLLDPPVRAALESADQIVLVTDTSATTARQVVASARMLPAETPTWLVANKMAKSSRLDLPQVIASIPGLKGVTVVPVPEGDLAENIVTSNFRWETAPEAWREPMREIAARLASHWRHLG